MSTSILIDRLSPYVPDGWNRTGNLSLLGFIEQGQNLLTNFDNPCFIWIGTENKGFEPYLNTVSGTYRYSITSANLANVTSITKNINGTDYVVRPRKILDVMVDVASDYDYIRKWIGEPFIRGYNNPYRNSNERIEFASIPVNKQFGLENTSAYVEFREDPGTSTDKYFLVFTYYPPKLTSELIPLIIPEEFEEALEDYVLGRIEKYENGSYGQSMQRFNEYWIPAFKSHMSGGANYDTLQSEALF